MGKPYRDGRVHVLTEKCDTCIFRPGNLMHLNPGRVKDLVESNIKAGAAITCHKTLYKQTPDEAVCRGFFDTYTSEVFALRLAQALDIITEVPPPTKEGPE